MNMGIKYKLNDIDKVVLSIRSLMAETDKSLLAFVGPIGAGKTTLIKKLVKSYGFDESEVSSPTFNYVNIYNTENRLVYHFDLYRLSNEGEFLEQGFQEYLYEDGSVAIIEWPEIISDLLRERALLIEIDYIDEDSRQLVIKSQ